MFKPVSAKEERLLPVYVYGSESLEHQAQISRGKGFMLHSQISVCYSGALFHGKQTTSLWADMLLLSL